MAVFSKKIILVVTVIIVLIGYLIVDYRFGLLIFKNNRSQELTQEEIMDISKSIASVQCFGPAEEGKIVLPVFGSGTFLSLAVPQPNRFTTIPLLVTNEHVSRDRTPNINYCLVYFSENNIINAENYYEFLYDGSSLRSGEITDLGLLYYNNHPTLVQDTNSATTILNTHLLERGSSVFQQCDEKYLIGSKVYVFGYPSSADSAQFPDISPLSNSLKGIWQQTQEYAANRHLIVSEGIISGKRGNNYYTTALIDTGSSGGLAVSKQKGKPCIVGIPTWGSVGDLTTLGVIQPFSNIYSAGFDWDGIMKLWEGKSSVR